MDNKSLWITIAFLLLMVVVGPFRIVAFLYDVGLYPPVTDEQVVTELKRMRHVETVSCQSAVGGWDFVCDYQQQQRDGPPVRHREGIRTSWTSAVARTVPMPADGPVLTEAQAAQWRIEENRRLAGPVNIRTATIEELKRIPGVDQYRAQEIQAAVRYGIVKKFDDLLKIQGIDEKALRLMRTRSYWM